MSAKNRFKPIPKDWTVPEPLGVDASRPIIAMTPAVPTSGIMKPRPEDIPTLVKSDTLQAFWVECTPEIMQACLALNKENYRPMLPGWRDQIKNDMEAKPTRFKQAGDPIRFDVDGIMIDAQHRFEAGVAAKFTFIFLFVVGLPKEAREVIDFLRPRKIAHVVKNMGHENAYLLSAAAGWLCKFKKGQELPSGLDGRRNSAGSVEEVLDMVKKHPQLSVSAKKCVQMGGQLLPGSLLAAVHYIGSMCLKRPQEADAFVWELRNYPKKAKQGGAPFMWCYELEQRKQRGLVIARDRKARGTVEAWNLFIRGIEMEDNIEIPERCAFQGLDYALL